MYFACCTGLVQYNTAILIDNSAWTIYKLIKILPHISFRLGKCKMFIKTMLSYHPPHFIPRPNSWPIRIQTIPTMFKKPYFTQPHSQGRPSSWELFCHFSSGQHWELRCYLLQRKGLWPGLDVGRGMLHRWLRKPWSLRPSPRGLWVKSLVTNRLHREPSESDGKWYDQR